jgi:hypothetical protein
MVPVARLAAIRRGGAYASIDGKYAKLKEGKVER